MKAFVLGAATNILWFLFYLILWPFFVVYGVGKIGKDATEALWKTWQFNHGEGIQHCHFWYLEKSEFSDETVFKCSACGTETKSLDYARDKGLKCPNRLKGWTNWSDLT